MEGWTKLQSGIAGLNIGQSANKFAKGFQSSVQATRERLGQVAPEEITELPQGAYSTRERSYRFYSDSVQSTRISRPVSTLSVPHTSLCSSTHSSRFHSFLPTNPAFVMQSYESIRV